MNLKRHHVLYIFLAMSLILGLVVLMAPRTPNMSFTASKSASSTEVGASPTSLPSLKPMKFEVVTTEAAQERGLGGRSDIPENYGMLFLFPSDTRIGFWMKDMLTSIDIIWLSDKGTIIGIEDSLSPATYPTSYYPPKPVKYVLETRAGETRRRGWTIGTTITLPLPYGS
jgi:uncharacterized membrane protein (UPF0127 family)